MIRIETHGSRDALADAAADAIGESLQQGGLLIVAGGSTPGPVYDRLCQLDLPWDRIPVTLTDERLVDPASDDSNERMVRGRLLRAKASAAPFLPLRDPDLSPLDEALAAELRLRSHLPASCVLLGMGEDGHVASLFPNSPELDEGLDLDSERLCLPVAHAGLAPFVPRLTLTAHALIQTDLLVLLVTGEAKRTLIMRIDDEPSYAPPAAAMLRQDRCPVRVLWAA